MKNHGLILLGILASIPFSSIAAHVDLARDDAALIRHIKITDDVFAKVLGTCTSEKLVRGKGGKFRYTGECKIKASPTTDCSSYLVYATGSVDTNAWATVREIRLSLQCVA